MNQIFSRSHSLLRLALSLLAALLLLGAAHGGPSLSIPVELPAVMGDEITVPIVMQPVSTPLAMVLFVLETNAGCLSFDATDADADGLPDAASFPDVPAAFKGYVSPKTGADLGDYEIYIENFSNNPPLLPGGDFARLTFEVTCGPTPDAAPRIEPVTFAPMPWPQASGPHGEPYYVAVQPGSLAIVLPTPTATLQPGEPTHTPTSLPTATPTGTLTPTPIPTATYTPSPTPTHTPTGTLTPTATATATNEPPTATPTVPSAPVCEDSDGVPSEPPGDADNDGKPNCQDPDDDGDGVPTAIEDDGDPDRDGIPSYLDADSNNNGIPDAIEVGPDPLHPVDADQNGIYDFLQMPGLFLPLVRKPR